MTTDPLVGKKLREYEILELIGKGGMAKVYRARHTLLDEMRAIKFLRPELREREECIARFRREAQIMVRLRHPNLVLLHEFGTVGNELFFLVMEYLEGESLRARLRRSGWIPVNESMAIVQQISQGLAEAHRHTIVHRDISPDNILMVRSRDQEVVKVIDFGIAKSMFPSGSKITQTMKLVGKAEYVAPEQISGDTRADGSEAIDARTDVYSLGVTFYELLTGAKPFEAKNSKAYLVKHLTEEPRAMSETNPLVNVSTALEDLVMRMLSKDQDDRPDSMEALYEELAALREDALTPTPA